MKYIMKIKLRNINVKHIIKKNCSISATIIEKQKQNTLQTI